MAKSFEKTLDSIEDLQEAIEYASTEKLTADDKKSEDLECVFLFDITPTVKKMSVWF